MNRLQISYNDLPEVTAQILAEVLSMKAMLLSLQNKNNQQPCENRHKPMTPEQVAAYTQIPLGTIYQKLSTGEIPGTKPGKRWVLYQDEVDKWLEVNRKNEIPMSAEELNASIMGSHRRKPKYVEKYG